MKKLVCSLLTIAGLVFLVASVSQAAAPASDNAMNAPYDDGWNTGDNGGSGFGAWTLTPGGGGAGNTASNGFFVGSSTNNGFQVDDTSHGGAANDGDIDTPSVGGRAWGMYANSGETASAVRPFTGTLSVGDVFSLDFDTGWNDSTVGFGLQNASGENLFEFLHIAGQVYQGNDFDGLNPTTVDWTDGGMTTTFRLTSANTYTFTVTTRGGAVDTITGSLMNPAGGQAVAQLRIFDFNAGQGSNFDTFANSMSITVIPEPATLSIFALGLAGLLGLRRMRRG